MDTMRQVYRVKSRGQACYAAALNGMAAARLFGLATLSGVSFTGFWVSLNEDSIITGFVNSTFYSE